MHSNVNKQISASQFHGPVLLWRATRRDDRGNKKKIESSGVLSFNDLSRLLLSGPLHITPPEIRDTIPNRHRPQQLQIRRDMFFRQKPRGHFWRTGRPKNIPRLFLTGPLEIPLRSPSTRGTTTTIGAGAMDGGDLLQKERDLITENLSPASCAGWMDSLHCSNLTKGTKNLHGKRRRTQHALQSIIVFSRDRRTRMDVAL